jgi:tetratricopeptide (TPR) repeat protein
MLWLSFRTVLVIGFLFAANQICLAAPTAKDKKLLEEVAAKLLAKCEQPEKIEWPPNIALEDDDDINAYASLVDKNGQLYQSGNGKIYPIVRINTGLMTKVIKSDDVGAADRLAYILGHELGHIVKGHCYPFGKKPKTPLLKVTFGRAEELEADHFGCELLLKAGFDFKRALQGIERMKEVLKELGSDYTSFEGLEKGHPSWDARLEKADQDKAHLWKAMAAFNNGVVFLATEDYLTAIDCFDKVTRTFPACYEAWANLGYARLMKYSDAWDKKDLLEQGIGQLVVGGFYTRTETRVRGKDKNLWFEAVGALREANRLKSGQTIVLANLGLAYLLHPDGKNVGEATRFFAEATEAARTDKTLDPVAHASLMINLGITTVAEGNSEKGLAQLDEGEKLVRSFTAPAAKGLAPSFDAALLYTRATVLAGKKDVADKEKAIGMFGRYLRITSPLSLWWDTAYDRYSELCKSLGREAKSKDAFKKERPEPIRLVNGIKLKTGTMTLGDDKDDVVKLFGKGKQSTAVPGTNLVRIQYETAGVEILATDEVVAIILNGPNAPSIPLLGKMTGTGTVGELKVGMTAKEAEALLGDDYNKCEISVTEVYYRFYRELGIAMLVSKGKVTELVVVKIPQSKN